jgi:putative transposase
MHKTLKEEATIPPAMSLKSQQKKLDAFLQEFNQVRPHEALGMKRPAQVYRPSTLAMPRKIETWS